MSLFNALNNKFCWLLFCFTSNQYMLICLCLTIWITSYVPILSSSHCVCAGVGKSCLLLRFSDDSFTTSFITTIGSVSKTFFLVIITILYFRLFPEHLIFLSGLTLRLGPLSLMGSALNYKYGILLDRNVFEQLQQVPINLLVVLFKVRGLYSY